MAQKINVEATDMPLNQLLKEWQDAYSIQISFDDDLLAKYSISLQKQFPNPDAAFRYLLKELPLTFEKTDQVYVVFYQEQLPAPRTYRLIGKIVDSDTGEPLAFSAITANGLYTTTDIAGVFSFMSKTDSLFQLRASHLGCTPLDTVLLSGNRHLLTLSPSLVKLQQIEVEGFFVNNATQIGQEAGQMSLNQYIANYLPGNGDNAIFNLLKMQPGVLAAGEQANDFIIWGSYEGTSRVTFDGFTLWGLNNFNDNISTVNPFLVKDVEVLKGAYDASNDDVVGGLIKINGKTGSGKQPSASLFINNQTLNGVIELPISDKSSILTAYRQSYRNLLDADDIIKPKQENPDRELLVSKPDYLFRDINMKYTFQSDTGTLFYVSFMRGSDHFSIHTNYKFPKSVSDYDLGEENVQTGTAAYYSKTWNSGISLESTLLYSSLATEYSEKQLIYPDRGETRVRRDGLVQNNVEELGVKVNAHFLVDEKNTLTIGAELMENKMLLTEDTFNIRHIDTHEEGNKLTLLVQDEQQLGGGISLQGGLRYNYSYYLQKQFIDPRLRMSIPLGENLKANVAWGKYHQFLVKSSTIDDDGNYRYRWALANGEIIPVIEAQHSVFDLTYSPQNWLLSACFFYKTNDDISRFIRSRNTEEVYVGQSYSRGFDIYAKRDINRHSLWASYSLSETMELFPYFREQEYRLAPQSQLHELKVGALFSIRDFYFSSTYILGSGFPIYEKITQSTYTAETYSRLDLALTYHLPVAFVQGELGISLLNVFNTNNEKYSRFVRIPGNQTSSIPIVNEAIPFTPLFFLKVKL